MSDRRFELRLTLECKEVKGGEETDFFDSKTEWHDLPYEGVVATQAVLIEALNTLNSFGVVQAASMGKGELLASLGLSTGLSTLAAAKDA